MGNDIKPGLSVIYGGQSRCINLFHREKMVFVLFLANMAWQCSSLAAMAENIYHFCRSFTSRGERATCLLVTEWYYEGWFTPSAQMFLLRPVTTMHVILLEFPI